MSKEDQDRRLAQAIFPADRTEHTIEQVGDCVVYGFSCGSPGTEAGNAAGGPVVCRTVTDEENDELEKFKDERGFITITGIVELKEDSEERAQEVVTEGRYSIDSIKAAFWATFHESGEVWFNYFGDPEDNERSTASEWHEFLEYLDKAARGEEVPKSAR